MPYRQVKRSGTRNVTKSRDIVKQDRLGYTEIAIHRPKIFFFEFQGMRPNIPHWIFYGNKQVTRYCNTIFSPTGGLGADARTDLRSTNMMFNIKPEGNVNNKWVVDNEYRQVGLLKNLLDSAAGTKFQLTEGLGLKQLVLTAPITGGLSWADDVTVSGDSNAQAWIDFFDDSATIWYHQDEETGFTPFRTGETITISGKTGSFTIGDRVVPDIDVFSGELLFLNNQAKIARDADQTEDIKIVIKL